MRCETRFLCHTYRGLVLVGVLPQAPSLADGVGQEAKFVIVIDATKGRPYQLLWQGQLSCKLLSTTAARA
jgi:hypothetical protein